MNLREYLKNIDTNTITMEDLSNSSVVNTPSNNSNDQTCCMELDIDSIENDFNIPKFVKTSLDENSIFNNALKYLEDGGNFRTFSVIYNDGKYYPDSTINNLSLAYLKKLRKEHPEIKMPTILCEVQNYEFNKDVSIYEEYMEKISNHMRVHKKTIYVNKNKDISCLLTVDYKNEDGLNIHKIINKADKNQLRKEIEFINKLESINKYKKDEYVKFEFDDFNQMVFIVDKKEVDINTIYKELLNECIKAYKENLDKLKKEYEINKANVEKYKNIMQRINAISKNLDNYDNLSTTFKGRLKLISKKERRVKLWVNKDSNLLDGNYLANIEDSIKKFDIYSVESHHNLSEIVDENKKLTEFIKYVDQYFSSINNNLENTENYLKELEEQQDQIENQPTIKILKEPIKLDRKLLMSSYSKKNKTIEDEEKETINNPFVALQRKQSDALSNDQKRSLEIYKTLLYRAINEIVRKKRTGGITEKEIDEICSISYNEYFSKPMFPSFDYKIGMRDKDLKIVSKEEFKANILSVIYNLEKSLRLVTLNEPLTVYRAISTDQIGKQEVGFLSTSISIDSISDFISEGRTDNGMSVVYKINLPEGSPVNFFSTEINKGKIDDDNPFLDNQQEVLIDSDNYDFEMVSVKTINDADVKRNNKTIYLVEINAKPKIKVGINEEERVR